MTDIIIITDQKTKKMIQSVIKLLKTKGMRVKL